MNTRQPALNRRRLARFTTCAQLWLQGIAGVLLALLAFDPRASRQLLQDAARYVGKLVFLHAALQRRSGPGGKRTIRRRHGMARALIGARLRRRLRARDPIAQFFAILEVMRDIGREARLLARRLARGLTRLFARIPRPEQALFTLAAGVLDPTCFADTS